MKIRCMAIDDEPIALEKLKKYIEDVPYLELVAACRGTYEASAILDEGNVDAVFIDMHDFLQESAVFMARGDINN